MPSIYPFIPSIAYALSHFRRRLDPDHIQEVSHLSLHEFQQLVFTDQVQPVFQAELVYDEFDSLLVSCVEFYLLGLVFHVDIHYQERLFIPWG